MTGRRVILTICLATEAGVITATDNTSGARVAGISTAGVLYLLGNEIERRYRELAALPRPWPHEARARDQLAAYFEEKLDDQRPMSHPRPTRRFPPVH